jgi:predicted ATPase/DNA-binding CsgD family transcriptional regulator
MLIQDRINNLPVPLSSFFDRKEESAAISALLLDQGVRLLNLTGTGGVGKTRLALAVASSIHQMWTSGVCFVPLQAVSNPEQVVPAIAQALELHAGNLQIFEALQIYLRPRHLLLVLDNFEQVVEAAPSVSALLAACQEVTVLVTSRQRLHVSGEYEFPILPLAVPNTKREYTPDKLITNPSVALFLHRAQAISPTFQFTLANAPDVAEICIHLEGVPLALELAAARVKLLPPRTLLSRLSHPLQILTTGYRDASERQQTLRNTIQWSYNLLSAEEQILFRRLCIFVGGCTLEAVEALYTLLSDDPANVFENTASLLDKNLLKRDEHEDGQPRFQMLETIRDFGLEYLQKQGEMERVQQAHACYYLSWAEASRKKMFGSEQGFLIKRYLQEQWNWRAAMRLLLEWQDKEDALRLVGGLSVFWMVWGYSFDQLYLIEGKNILEQLLPTSKQSLTTARAWALGVYGGILAMLRNLESSEIMCREGLALARKVEDVQYIITGLWMLLLPLLTQDDFKAARGVVEEAVSLAQALQEDCTDWDIVWLKGYSLHRAGYVALWQGRYTLAREMLLETIALCSQNGELFFTLWSNLYLGEVDFFEGKDEDARERLEFAMSVYKSLQIRTQVAEALGFLGLLSLRQGNIEEAHAQLSESLRMRKEVGDEQGIAWSEIWLARVESARQNIERAHSLLQEGLARALKASSRLYTAMGLEEWGKVAAKQGKVVWAAQLFGAAETLRDAMGAPVPLAERNEHEKQIAAVREALGEAHWSRAWMQGRGMAPEQVIRWQEATPASHSPQEVEVALPRLTRRELEVVRLLAEGLTNAQIAEKLNLSTVTVSAYLRSTYQKLGVSSRTAALRFALDHHLL